jgi:beta-xylosidase
VAVADPASPTTAVEVAAPPAPVEQAAAPTSAPSRPPAAARTATTRPPRAVAATAAPVVKAPPPRPSRTSEAPTQPESGPSTSAPAPAAPGTPPRPATTVRYAQDFPDPFVFRAGPFWYALSTQRGLAEVPVIRSTDLVHWEDRGDALPRLPQWSRFGSVWAPSVLAVTGGFVLYYATTDGATGLQCLSEAFSPLPDGPYVDASTGPLLCQTDRGGSIDPSPFRAADGRPWLAWKSEGTLDGEPTRLWSAPLADDGRSFSGPAAELLHTSAPWEGPIVEAPSMVVTNGRYDLFYSGNRWETASYATGHARCDGPAGPCRRTSESPVLRTHSSEAGSGGGSAFIEPDGSIGFAYHAWDPLAVGYPGGLRRLRIGTVHLDGDGATIEPTEVPAGP